MDFGTIEIIFVFLAIIVQVFFMIFFKVRDIHLGLPSSMFGGRFKSVDSDGHSIPIGEPYGEGWKIKFPWWTVTQIYREVKTLIIDKKEYQISGTIKNISPDPDKEKESVGDKYATGGTVLVSGVIQYRPSELTLYRFEEVNEEGIEKGLYSEVDQIIGHYLGNINLEDAITRKKEVSEELRKRLTGFNIGPRSGEDNEQSKKTRKLFGRDVTYAEHSYGIEVLKVSVDSIQPDIEIKKERDKKQQEKYQKESETIEWGHYLDRMNDLKTKFPTLNDKELLEAVLIWKGHIKKDVKDFKIDGFAEAMEKIFGGKK